MVLLTNMTIECTKEEVIQAFVNKHWFYLYGFINIVVAAARWGPRLRFVPSLEPSSCLQFLYAHGLMSCHAITAPRPPPLGLEIPF